MPDQTLAQLVRAKYPGAYDKLSDQQLEAAVSAKYPGAYDRVPRTPLATEPARTPGRPTGPATIGEVTKAAAAVQPQPKRSLVDRAGDALESAAHTAEDYVLGGVLRSGVGGTLYDVAKTGATIYAPGSRLANPLAQRPEWTKPRNTAETAGMVSEKVAELAAPAALAKSAVPTFARAGANFQEVMGAAKNVPINISGPGNQALRIMQLAERGGTMPKSVRDFLKRVTDPEKAPMTYEEARDFASNISRLSADEFNRLTPVMRREIGTLRVALNDSVASAAKAAGKLPQYQAAMKEYAQRAKLDHMRDDVWNAAKRYAVPGGIAYYAMRKLGDAAHGVFGDGD